MNIGTIVPILAFIGISVALLFQTVQYFKYRKKHKKPNIPALKRSAYAVNSQQFINKIDQQTQEKKVSITKNKQKIKLASYAIVSIFIVFVGVVILFTRNKAITYVPRAAESTNPTILIPTESQTVLNSDNTSTIPSIIRNQPPVTSPPVTPTQIPTRPVTPTAFTKISPTAGFRALLSRTISPTPENTNTPTPIPSVTTTPLVRNTATPAVVAQKSATSQPTYIAYLITKKPTEKTHIEETTRPITPEQKTSQKSKEIPSTGFIEASLLLLFAGGAFLLIGFLF